MNVTITKIVREFTLDVEPTVVLNGTYYEDGSFHLDRRGRQVVTSAKVRVTEGEQPFVQLFGSNLNADGTRSKRGQFADVAAVVVGLIVIAKYQHGAHIVRQHDRTQTTC